MINVRLFNSLFELLEAFPTEESCIKYLESLRWGKKVLFLLLIQLLRCIFVIKAICVRIQENDLMY